MPHTEDKTRRKSLPVFISVSTSVRSTICDSVSANERNNNNNNKTTLDVTETRGILSPSTSSCEGAQGLQGCSIPLCTVRDIGHLSNVWTECWKSYKECAAMMQSSTKSPTITVFRLRSDRKMFGSFIPLVFPGRYAGCEEDRSSSDRTHATTTTTTTMNTTVNGTASGAEVAVPHTNKSDYIYLTQSTDDSRALLVTRFPLDDLGASRALVGHITELMRTTNSVTLKCDLNAYLSNVSISRNLALDQCTTLSRNAPTADRGNRCGGGGGSYIRFNDLLAMVANEKALLKRRSALESQGRVLPRLRLCGGGEDSINNGTSAWGTPPASTNGTSAWGIPNQQQQPPQAAWGGTAGNNSANNNNNNNNNQPTSSQSQRQSSQSQDYNANKAPQQGGGSAAPGGNSGGTPNPWNRNPTQPQQQQQQPQQQQPPGPNPNQQPPQQQQQQQQQQQLVMGNNGNVATKSQLEQLSHLREALFSQDGWGCQNVNQDTNWEVPGSPEPPKPEASNSGAAGGGNGGGGGGGPNPQAVTGWKPCNLNNGTELWEANLRNGGQPPPPQAPVQKTPWGPASNIGGTWGEDDDSGEANVWNGATGGNPPAATPQAWGQNNPPMWPPGVPAGPNPAAVVKKDNDWAGVGVIGNAGAAAVPPAVPGWDSRGAPVPAVNVPGPIGQTNPIEAVREIRGDPRGISGRLNGNVGMWDQQNVPNLPTGAKLAQGSLPSVGGGANSQWNTPVPNKLPGGWDDSPSPMNNRPTLDDGGLWNQGQLSRQNSNVSSWKDMSDSVVRTPMPRTPLGGGANLPLGPVTRGVRGMNPGMKPDQSSMWGQNQGLPMNGSWDDCAGAGGINNWDDKGLGAAGGGNGPWNDFGQSNLWKQGKQVGGWPDPSDLMGGGAGSGNDWSMNKPPSKMSPVEIIRSSKQYRMLCENGFKKEDVELVLRTTNMNFDESLEILQRHNTAGDWRGRPDEHPFDAPFSNRFPAGPGGGMPFSQNQNLLNNLPGVGGGGGPNPNLAALNNLKYLSQTPGGGGGGGHSSFGSQPGPNPLAAGAQQNPQAQQPSTQHLRMLVQQIQMAVHAGFLNHQILNQPLAPQTLILLNQLLTNIRQMQHIQNNLARSGGATGVSAVQLTMQINKHKSTISQLQQQIAAQQAIYVKQQQQQQQPGGPHQPPNVGLGGAADFLRQQDLVSLQNNFADMTMGKEPVTPTGGGFPSGVAGNSGGGMAGGATSVTSRLNQWKLPSLEKDGANDLTDFSRAPGTTAKSTLSTASSNIGSLGLQDGTWSSGRSTLADGWPDQPTGAGGGGDADNKDWNSAQDNAAFSDLVPEFEPGKPWKGAQLKIDEDPSITPGSVARSPLSIATAKEADLFGGGGGGGAGKVSPTDPMGLGSSTWGKPGKNVWPDSITSTGAGGGGGGSSSDLWGAPMGKTTRGPPPGLGANKNANGWAGGAAGGGAQRSGSGGNWPSGNGWGSSWLLLKNLTSQIDGATLRTLCMQHGPLQSLQLYPNHGLALCKYSSREEASKAQQALNNCPLGGTNIGAECPSESDAQTYLQQLGAPAVGGIGSSGSIVPPSSSGPVTSVAQSWRQTPRTTGADTWGSGWPPSSGAGATGSGGLWAPLEGSTGGTPSNLNSFLPESLLGTDLN